MNAKMKIGEFARQAGVSPDTARFYERLGLLQPLRLEHNNYRLYGAGEVERVRLIRKARSAGFSLADAGEIVGLLKQGKRDCTHYAELAQRKLRDLDEQIRVLQSARRALKSAMQGCEAEADECRFVAPSSRSSAIHSGS